MRWWHIPFVALLAGCPNETPGPSDTGSDPGPTTEDPDPTDPQPDLEGTDGAVQDLLRAVADVFPGYSDAAARLFDAYSGGAPAGVTLSPPGPNRSGTVSVDLDLDGAYDEDWSVQLISETDDGPVQLIANTGAYFRAASTGGVSALISTDGETAFADLASVDVYNPAVSFHGSGGAFQFVAGPPAGASAGTMSYVAYTGEPNGIIEGDLEILAKGAGLYSIVVSYAPSAQYRGVSGTMSEDVGCQCYGTTCDQGSAPSTFFAAGTLLALVTLRRRR